MLGWYRRAKATKRGGMGGEESERLILCAGQRVAQEGSSPSGALVESAVSKSGGNASLAVACGWRGGGQGVHREVESEGYAEQYRAVIEPGAIGQLCPAPAVDRLFRRVGGQRVSCLGRYAVCGVVDGFGGARRRNAPRPLTSPIVYFEAPDGLRSDDRVTAQHISFGPRRPCE